MIKRIATMVMVSGLSACSVGPDFKQPAAPDVDRYTPEKMSVIQGGSGPGTAPVVRLVENDVPQRWWSLFRNPALDTLVKSAIEHNPSLTAAEAAIRVAYFNAEAQKGQFLPQIAGGAGTSRNLVSNNQSVASINQQNLAQQLLNPNPATIGTSTPYTLWVAQLNVSYVVDVWGQNRRAVEALEAQTDQQRYQLEAAYLTLTSNIVVAAITEASLVAQIAAVERVVAIERDLLGLARQQQDKGAIAAGDVLMQEAALAQALALIPPLQKQVGINRDFLTALAGRYASDEISEHFRLGNFRTAKAIPVSVPSRLVRNRPDVRAAEANLHAASAEIGVTVAARLPNLSISGSRGASAFDLARLFVPGTNLYSIGASVAQPVFDGFTLLNHQKAAEAGFTQAEAIYRQSVITAFQNVADALRSLEADTRALKTAVYAEQVALKSLNIVREQFRSGAIAQLSVLNAQQTYLTASLTRAQAEGNRLGDIAALFMSLGGGWSDIGLRDQPADPVANPSGEATPTHGPVNKSWFPSFWD